MKTLNCTILTALICLHAYNLSAATLNETTNIGSASTQQQMDQSKAKTATDKHRMAHAHRQPHADMSMKMIDTDHDGMVSKQEFLAFHERKFDMMKQIDGKVSLKELRNEMHHHAHENSMNNKPIGTTSENPSVNAKDAINGKKY